MTNKNANTEPCANPKLPSQLRDRHNNPALVMDTHCTNNDINANLTQVTGPPANNSTSTSSSPNRNNSETAGTLHSSGTTSRVIRGESITSEGSTREVESAPGREDWLL
jgi:hypothetical protein